MPSCDSLHANEGATRFACSKKRKSNNDSTYHGQATFKRPKPVPARAATDWCTQIRDHAKVDSFAYSQTCVVPPATTCVHSKAALRETYYYKP
eukprot:3035617-Pleurochrysis_carterae.AAC.1